MLASDKLIDDFVKISQYTTTGIPTIAQYGAITALKQYPVRDEIINENRQRMEFFAKGLEQIGFEVVKPEGAFYLFANYEKLSNKNSIDFCKDIMEKTHVGIVPGICFMVENYVRFSIGKDFDELSMALDRLKKYFEEQK